MARDDEKVHRQFFFMPTALSAGAEAAAAASSSSSSGPQFGQEVTAGGSQASFFKRLEKTVQDVANRAVQQALKHTGRGTGASTKGADKGHGRGGGKAKSKAKDKGAGVNLDAGTGPSKSQVHMATVRAGACIRHNKGGCKHINCEWPHNCAVCGKKGCMAIKHTLNEVRAV